MIYTVDSAELLLLLGGDVKFQLDSTEIIPTRAVVTYYYFPVEGEKVCTKQRKEEEIDSHPLL